MINREDRVTIHYCWFGKGVKGEKIEKCIQSWRHYYPNANIVEWNEKNFNVKCNDYVKEAYASKKYAFVSDYARLKIIYENGGVYLDTDVEIIKRYSEEMLKSGFLGLEKGKINTGLGFCAKKGEKVLKKMMDDYEKIHFLLPNNSYDMTTCVERNTLSIKKLGYCTKAFRKIGTITLYPDEFFNPYNYNTGKTKITNNTRTIHHCEASWLTAKRRGYLLKKQSYVNKYGITLGKMAYYIFRIKEGVKK